MKARRRTYAVSPAREEDDGEMIEGADFVDDDDEEEEEAAAEDGTTSEDDEEEEAAMEAAALARIRGRTKGAEPEGAYDSNALHARLEAIAWQHVPWNEHMSITVGADAAKLGGPPAPPAPPAGVAEAEDLEDANDDAKRELCFYSQAHSAVLSALGHLQDTGTQWRRPSDYFAEMVKSDSHMAKIQKRLLEEKKTADESEERKKQRALKRYSKQVQAEKLREKAREKKENVQNVEKWRKERARNGYSPLASETEVDPEYISMALKAKRQLQGNYGERLTASAVGKSKKRKMRDEKYGHGGRKRLKKQNSRDSANDVSSYKPASNGGQGGRRQQQWQEVASRTGEAPGQGEARRESLEVVNPNWPPHGSEQHPLPAVRCVASGGWQRRMRQHSLLRAHGPLINFIYRPARHASAASTAKITAAMASRWSAIGTSLGAGTACAAGPLVAGAAGSATLAAAGAGAAAGAAGGGGIGAGAAAANGAEPTSCPIAFNTTEVSTPNTDHRVALTISTVATQPSRPPSKPTGAPASSISTCT